MAKSLKGTIRKVLSRKIAKIQAELQGQNQIARDSAAQREQRMRFKAEVAGQHDENAHFVAAQRAKLEHTVADLLAKIANISYEIGPLRTSPKKTAEAAFRAMDGYIRGN